MEYIVLHLKLMRSMMGTPVAYVVQHIKVVYIPPQYGAYLNLDEDMITRAPIVDAKTNLKLSQESLDRVYLDHQVGTFKIDNVLCIKFSLRCSQRLMSM